MEYWEMDIGKVNDFTNLNEQVEECYKHMESKLSNVRRPSYSKQKTFEYCLWNISRLYIQFLIRTWWRAVSLSMEL